MATKEKAKGPETQAAEPQAAQPLLAQPVLPSSGKEALEAIARAYGAILVRLKNIEMDPLSGGTHQILADNIRAKTEAANKRASDEYQRIIRPRAQEIANLEDKEKELQTRAKDVAAGLMFTPGETAAQKEESRSIEDAHRKLATSLGALRTTEAKEGALAIKEESAALVKIYEEMCSYLDEVRALAQSTVQDKKLGEAVKASFSERAQKFNAEVTSHKNQARVSLAAMVVLSFCTMVVVYVLFIHTEISIQTIPKIGSDATASDAKNPDHKEPQGTPVIYSIEQIALLASGRVAVLFMLGWAIRYAANLHRKHSEQAVIYSDRSAALGIIEILLDSAPDIEQRRSILRLLAKNYINFEQSAFRDKSTDTIEATAKSLRVIADAAKPVIDSVKSIVDKGAK